ncbi:repetitive organellar protein isoform X1 [Hydra vulgaris]|uniref:repetitive organellar protein isoform X1 n=1 Tax=Hydra vulgaris TaxID=6087 RepID=UPI0032E9ED68
MPKRHLYSIFSLGPEQPSHSGRRKFRGNDTETSFPMPQTERQQLAYLLSLTANEVKCETNEGPEVLANETKKRSRDKLSSINKPKNKSGETQLHLCATKGDLDITKSLVRKGADVNCRDNAGWTPLHEACNHGHFKVAKFLLRAGAEVNAQGFDGDTPLHDASSNGHLEIVVLLLRHGGNPHQKNDKGRTPIDVADSDRVLEALKNFTKDMLSDLKPNKDMEIKESLKTSPVNEKEQWSFQKLKRFSNVDDFLDAEDTDQFSSSKMESNYCENSLTSSVSLDSLKAEPKFDNDNPNITTTCYLNKEENKTTSSVNSSISVRLTDLSFIKDNSLKPHKKKRSSLSNSSAKSAGYESEEARKMKKRTDNLSCLLVKTDCEDKKTELTLGGRTSEQVLKSISEQTKNAGLILDLNETDKVGGSSAALHSNNSYSLTESNHSKNHGKMVDKEKNKKQLIRLKGFLDDSDESEHLSDESSLLTSNKYQSTKTDDFINKSDHERPKKVILPDEKQKTDFQNERLKSNSDETKVKKPRNKFLKFLKLCKKDKCHKVLNNDKETNLDLNIPDSLNSKKKIFPNLSTGNSFEDNKKNIEPKNIFSAQSKNKYGTVGIIKSSSVSNQKELNGSESENFCIDFKHKTSSLLSQQSSPIKLKNKVFEKKEETMPEKKSNKHSNESLHKSIHTNESEMYKKSSFKHKTISTNEFLELSNAKNNADDVSERKKRESAECLLSSRVHHSPQKYNQNVSFKITNKDTTLKKVPEANEPIKNKFEANEPIKNKFDANEPIKNKFEANEPIKNKFEANEPIKNKFEANEPIKNKFEANEPIKNKFEANEPIKNKFEDDLKFNLHEHGLTINEKLSTPDKNATELPNLPENISFSVNEKISNISLNQMSESLMEHEDQKKDSMFFRNSETQEMSPQSLSNINTVSNTSTINKSCGFENLQNSEIILQESAQVCKFELPFVHSQNLCNDLDYSRDNSQNIFSELDYSKDKSKTISIELDFNKDSSENTCSQTECTKDKLINIEMPINDPKVECITEEKPHIAALFAEKIEDANSLTKVVVPIMVSVKDVISDKIESLTSDQEQLQEQLQEPLQEQLQEQIPEQLQKHRFSHNLLENDSKLIKPIVSKDIKIDDPHGKLSTKEIKPVFVCNSLKDNFALLKDETSEFSYSKKKINDCKQAKQLSSDNALEKDLKVISIDSIPKHKKREVHKLDLCSVKNCDFKADLHSKYEKESKTGKDILKEPFKDIKNDKDIVKEVCNETKINKEIPKESLKELKVNKDMPKETCKEIKINKNVLKESCSEGKVNKEIIKDSCKEIKMNKNISKEACKKVKINKYLAKETCKDIKINKEMPKETCKEIKINKEMPKETCKEIKINKEMPKEACKEIKINKEMSKETCKEIRINKEIPKETCKEIKTNKEMPKETCKEIKINKEMPKETCKEIKINKEMPKETCKEIKINKEMPKETCKEIKINKEMPKETCKEIKMNKEMPKETCKEIKINKDIQKEICIETKINQNTTKDTSREINKDISKVTNFGLESNLDKEKAVKFISPVKHFDEKIVELDLSKSFALNTVPSRKHHKIELPKSVIIHEHILECRPKVEKLKKKHNEKELKRKHSFPATTTTTAVKIAKLDQTICNLKEVQKLSADSAQPSTTLDEDKFVSLKTEHLAEKLESTSNLSLNLKKVKVKKQVNITQQHSFNQELPSKQKLLSKQDSEIELDNELSATLQPEDSQIRENISLSSHEILNKTVCSATKQHNDKYCELSNKTSELPLCNEEQLQSVSLDAENLLKEKVEIKMVFKENTPSKIKCSNKPDENKKDLGLIDEVQSKKDSAKPDDVKKETVKFDEIQNRNLKTSEKNKSNENCLSKDVAKCLGNQTSLPVSDELLSIKKHKLEYHERFKKDEDSMSESKFAFKGNAFKISNNNAGLSNTSNISNKNPPILKSKEGSIKLKEFDINIGMGITALKELEEANRRKRKQMLAKHKDTKEVKSAIKEPIKETKNIVKELNKCDEPSKKVLKNEDDSKNLLKISSYSNSNQKSKTSDISQSLENSTIKCIDSLIKKSESNKVTVVDHPFLITKQEDKTGVNYKKSFEQDIVKILITNESENCLENENAVGNLLGIEDSIDDEKSVLKTSFDTVREIKNNFQNTLNFQSFADIDAFSTDRKNKNDLIPFEKNIFQVGRSDQIQKGLISSVEEKALKDDKCLPNKLNCTEPVPCNRDFNLNLKSKDSSLVNNSLRDPLVTENAPDYFLPTSNFSTLATYQNPLIVEKTFCTDNKSSDLLLSNHLTEQFRILQASQTILPENEIISKVGDCILEMDTTGHTYTMREFVPVTSTNSFPFLQNLRLGMESCTTLHFSSEIKPKEPVLISEVVSSHSNTSTNSKQNTVLPLSNIIATSLKNIVPSLSNLLANSAQNSPSLNSMITSCLQSSVSSLSSLDTNSHQTSSLIEQTHFTESSNRKTLNTISSNEFSNFSASFSSDFNHLNATLGSDVLRVSTSSDEVFLTLNDDSNQLNAFSNDGFQHSTETVSDSFNQLNLFSSGTENLVRQKRLIVPTDVSFVNQSEPNQFSTVKKLTSMSSKLDEKLYPLNYLSGNDQLSSYQESHKMNLKQNLSTSKNSSSFKEMLFEKVPVSVNRDLFEMDNLDDPHKVTFSSWRQVMKTNCLQLNRSNLTSSLGLQILEIFQIPSHEEIVKKAGNNEKLKDLLLKHASEEEKLRLSLLQEISRVECNCKLQKEGKGLASVNLALYFQNDELTNSLDTTLSFRHKSSHLPDMDKLLAARLEALKDKYLLLKASLISRHQLEKDTLCQTQRFETQLNYKEILRQRYLHPHGKVF